MCSSAASSPCKPSPQQTQPSSTMFRGKRLRSRTPPRSRSSGGECLFCSEPIAEQDKWVCFVCPVQAHKRCEEHWRRTPNASRGCPQCRTTKTDVVTEHELRLPPKAHCASSVAKSSVKAIYTICAWVVVTGAKRIGIQSARSD